MIKAYLYLAISIISEVFAISMLKLSNGLSVLWPSVGVLIGFALTYGCLSLCLKHIPLSVAYAIWAGVGTASTAVIGVLFWNEAFTPVSFIGLVCIIGGVIFLNLSTKEEEKETPPSIVENEWSRP